MTEKFFCLSLCSLCCNLPHFFSFTPLWLSAWPQTLTVKEIEPPPSPPPPPLPHSVSLCFTNWSHSESTGIKTKRDIPPFFPTSPWPHTRSRTHVYWVSVCECVYVCVCVCAHVCVPLWFSDKPQTGVLSLILTIGVDGRICTAPSFPPASLSPLWEILKHSAS